MTVYIGPDGLAKCLPVQWPQFTEVETFPHTGKPYSALEGAFRALIARGLNYGPAEGDLPVAVMTTRSRIPRWSALELFEQALLFGVLYPESEDLGYRSGPVTLRLRVLERPAARRPDPAELQAAAGGA